MRKEKEPRRERELLSLSAHENRDRSSLLGVRVFGAELFRPRRISRGDSSNGEKKITSLDAGRIRRA